MFENIIRKQLNADEQENASADNADASTATTTAPVEESGNSGVEEAPASEIPQTETKTPVRTHSVTDYFSYLCRPEIIKPFGKNLHV